MIRSTIPALIASLAVSANAVAFTVSGAFSDNSAVVITGQGFGSHPMQVEALHDAIESGADGNNLSRTNWSVRTEWSPTKYASDDKHSRGKSLKTTPSAASAYNGTFVYRLPNPVTSNGTLYMSWWVRYSGATNGQWKILRISRDDTISDGDQQLVFFNWFSQQQTLTNFPSSDGSGSGTFWFGDIFPPEGVWCRMEVLLKVGSGASKGSMQIGRYLLNGSNRRQETASNLTAQSGVNYQYLLWQNYLGNGISGTSQIWFDDIYVQTGSAKRVELCDSAIWSSRKRCEVQVPTSWSDSSIEIKVQQGTFASGSTAYLFVVGDNNEPIASNVVVIGGTAVQPSPPAGLLVN